MKKNSNNSNLLNDNFKKPSWLRVKMPSGDSYSRLRSLVDKYKLNTICQSGNCPNMGECWGAGTATFMILGNICTRSCSFCAVKTGKPLSLDLTEPYKVANSVHIMKIKHCVLTSVNRDDLKDGGANIWVQTIKSIRKKCKDITLETLLPDFKGDWKNLNLILNEKPEIVSHNIETVPRLTKKVRIQAKYERSLECLEQISNSGIKTKSGIMLGLGEHEHEVISTMDDLLKKGVRILTIGQYLQPSKIHHPVVDYIKPEQFQKLKQIGLSKGFKYVESGPLVRSSYHAEKHLV
ncbi:MAG: lipoyl synthase [Bacteroides sp.]|nr:MAG: lipoyl synthase [Bacteroides sp.]